MTVFRTKKRDTVEKLFVSLIGVQMLSFISQIIANVIDTVVIKRCLGSDAMAAFSFANTAISVEMAVFGFLMTGVSVMLSRNANEQDEKKRGGAYSTAVILAFALGCVLTLAYLAASERIAKLSGAPERLQGPAAEYIRENTEPDALFLTDDNHDNPVAVLTGRNILCGSPSYLFYHGLDYSQRQKTAEQMLTDPAFFERRKAESGVEYVFIGHYERAVPGIAESYFREHYPLAFSSGSIEIFDVRP